MYISTGNNWCHKITVISLFVCIFLENGAINDVWNNEISLPQWSKNLLYLEDGHFGRDKLLFLLLIIVKDTEIRVVVISFMTTSWTDQNHLIWMS